MMSLLSACVVLHRGSPGLRSSPQALFSYVRRRPSDPSTGVLQGIWLPSRRRATMPGPSSGYRPSSAPTGLRVSPDSRFVAWIASQDGDRFLWIYEVRPRILKQAALLVDRIDRLEWLDSKSLFLVQAGSMFTALRRAGGWSIVRDWPSGRKAKRRESRLTGFETALMRRWPGMGHRPISVSPDGLALAVIDSRSGGTLERPDPMIRTGYVRKTIAAYDPRTLLRTIKGPTWEQFQSDPPEYAFAGFAPWNVVVVRAPQPDVVPQVLLYGRDKGSPIPLPSLVADAWSLGGSPWLEFSRGLRSQEVAPQ